MIKITLNFTLMALPFFVLAQKRDSTHTHYQLYRGTYAHFTELKSKRGVKNGEAEFYNGKKVVAKGIYKDDLRIGRWQFFKPDSTYKTYELEQIYNYSTKKLEYNKPDSRISYELDSLNEGDKIIYPAKIGGFSGYRMFFKFHQPVRDLHSVESYKEFHVFKIDASGKLVKYELTIRGTREDGT